MLQQVRERFFSVGWMLPVLVPVAGMLGRALGNSLFFLYLLWALLALRPRDVWMPSASKITYLVLVAVCFLSVMFAVESGEAMHFWLRWLAYMLVLPITLAVLSSQSLDISRLERLLAFATLLALITFLYRWLPTLWQAKAVPINSMAMAYQFPFLIAWLIYGGQARPLWWLLAALIGVGSMGLFFANSSTEILVVVVGILVYLSIRSRLGKRVLLGALLLVPMVLAVELIPKLSHLHTSNWLELLDAWSSRRTTMWVRAIQDPPENIWLGVGMGNAQYAWPVSSIGVKGFHNFIFDAWYETGVLGLGALLAFLGALGWAVIRGFRAAPAQIKMRSAPWLASVAAILVAASLDHSYASVSFAMLMMFEVAVLLALTGQVPARPQNTAR